MMRPVRGSISADASLAEARRRFSLGSLSQAVITDGSGAYAGLLPVAALYVEPADLAKSETTVGALAEHKDAVLKPEMAIKEIMEVFDRTTADELTVVDPAGQPLGMVSESYATRRYADELEKARRDLIGEN
jgi:chloride channel protein, CIC family